MASEQEFDDEQYDIDSLGRNKVRNRRYSICDTIDSSGQSTPDRFRRSSITVDGSEQRKFFGSTFMAFEENEEAVESAVNTGVWVSDSRRGSRQILPLTSRRRSSVDEVMVGRLRSVLVAQLEESLNRDTKIKPDYRALSDTEIAQLVSDGHLSIGKLESVIGNLDRSVAIRRSIIAAEIGTTEAVDKIPVVGYDYSQIYECCCENTIGYVQIPLGIVGPLPMNGKRYRVPMATTEGCLVASANRGCRAFRLSGEVKAYIVGNGMTRGPVVRFASAGQAVDAYNWLSVDENYATIKKAFDSTSNYARLTSIKTQVVARYLYIRFKATTGKAMGMNMLSKGTEMALKELEKHFPDIEMTCISGNYCTDKKASLDNWIEGRGKSIVAEIVIPGRVVESVLNTRVADLVALNVSKNLIGSGISGTIGGFNAHAANTVAAIFIATGQDPAQVVCSSGCITLMEAGGDDGADLYLSCTMPSLEVGTVGGATHLTSQRGCLEILALNDFSAEELAQVICGTVMAAEVSLMAALCSGDLVKCHMNGNRVKK